MTRIIVVLVFALMLSPLTLSACAGGVNYAPGDGGYAYEGGGYENAGLGSVDERAAYANDNARCVCLWEYEFAPSEFHLIDGSWVSGVYTRAYFAENNRPMLIEQFLGKFDSFTVFSEFDCEEWRPQYFWMAFVSDVPLEGFRLIELDHEARPGYNYYCERGELFSADELPPGHLLIVSTDWGYIHPTRGISFVGEDGEIRRFAVQLNFAGYPIPPLALVDLEIYNRPPPERENEGLTSASVRLHLVDSESVRQWYPAYRLIDLSKTPHYHEFVYNEGGLRIAFTTETQVRDFRYLRIVWNDDFFREGAGEGERRYNVREVLYSTDVLAPGIPLVVTGADLGCALAANGFSFVSEEGTARYFSFLQCGKTGYILIGEF